MMNAMNYKGYTARIEYDDEDRIFVGRLEGIRDILGFHGTTVDELEIAFHESVDDYVRACEKLGQSPQKPASGKLILLLSPNITQENNHATTRNTLLY